MKEVMGANHKVNSPKSATIFLDDDGAALVRFSDRPKTLSKSCYEIFKKNYLMEFSTD